MNRSDKEDWLLVVEDQLEAWWRLKPQLTHVLAQVPLVHASNGPTALSYLASCLVEANRLPKLILTKLYMPQLKDGLGLLARLKEASSPYAHLPTLVVSSSRHANDYREITRRGGIYVQQPVEADEWRAFATTLEQYWVWDGQEETSLPHKDTGQE